MIHWSIFSFALTIWLRKSQDLHRIQRQVNNVNHSPKHVFPSKGFYLQPGTYLNLPEKGQRFHSWLFLGIFWAKFHFLLMNQKMKYCLNICLYQPITYYNLIECLSYLCIWHFSGLSICNLKKHQEAREYNRKMIQMVCPAYEHSDTQIVEPSELIVSSWRNEWYSPPHLSCTHQDDNLNHLKGFQSSDSCNHRLLHILELIISVYKSERLHLIVVWLLRPLKYRTQDQKVYKIPRKKAYESWVYLNFCV